MTERQEDVHLDAGLSHVVSGWVWRRGLELLKKNCDVTGQGGVEFLHLELLPFQV